MTASINTLSESSDLAIGPMVDSRPSKPFMTFDTPL
jgi:hypothetical protein